MRPRRRRIAPLAITVALAAAAALGHRWLALGWNAWGYPVAAPTARTAVASGRELAYVAAGTDGIEVVEPENGARRSLLPPPMPADRIDDLALAGDLLFALDATAPGHLAVYRQSGAGLPALAGPPVEVPVGPFSGVSAAAGVVVVSGGTSRLTLRRVDRDGRLGREVASADYGRGQPDVALRPDGRMAAVSTHLVGPRFALTLVEIHHEPLRLRRLGELELREAGFTRGGSKPAHFPLVAAWRGERLYVADGGGLAVVDVSVPARPRLVRRERGARPAVDVVVSGDELDVARAGPQPAVLRYGLDASGLPTLQGFWQSGDAPASIARHGAALLAARHGGGWQHVPASELRSIPTSERPIPRRER